MQVGSVCCSSLPLSCFKGALFAELLCKVGRTSCFLPLEQGTPHGAGYVSSWGSCCQAARGKKTLVAVGFEHNGPRHSLGLRHGVLPLFIVQKFPRAFPALSGCQTLPESTIPMAADQFFQTLIWYWETDNEQIWHWQITQTLSPLSEVPLILAGCMEVTPPRQLPSGSD